MKTLRAPTFTGGNIEVRCEAAWYGPGSENWNRGLTLLKRKRGVSVRVARVPGRGLLIKNIPGSPDITIEERTWNAFVGNQSEQLVASIGRLYLTFTRTDLAALLPHDAHILPFRRSA